MTGIPVAITSEGLFSKSTVYIHRGFQAKDAGDLDQYQLWLSLALELLGKAALSSIHPCLVVDPLHAGSMFAAAGKPIGADIKTIGSKTIFERLSHLSKYFDKGVKDFCDAIALRRNAELHSGEVPFQEMKLEAWEGNFWHASQVILDILGFELEEWLGANASAQKMIIKEARLARVSAAVLRVKQAKEHFLLLKASDRKEAVDLSKKKRFYHYHNLFNAFVEDAWDVTCPACGGRAYLGGDLFEESIVGGESEHSWEEEVAKSYGAEEFFCPTCELRLNGRDEIEAADLDPDYTKFETREREYEMEYGND